MILVIDSGNTNIVFGLYKKDKLIHRFRIFTNKNKTADEYEIVIRSLLGEKKLTYRDLKGVAISNVVPALLSMWEELFKKHTKLEPLWINTNLKLPVAVKIDKPEELGADILAGAVGAVKKYTPPLVIIDFGTATTFFAVSENKEILGGAISPGLNLSAEALYFGAPHLPRIKLAPPANIIGTNTEHSMQAGILCGYIFLVDGMVRQLKARLGKNTAVIATGGLAEEIFIQSKSIDHIEPDLIINGIFEIYKYQLETSA